MEVCDLAFDNSSWRGGVLPVSKNPRCKVGGHLDVTSADEICEVAETTILSDGAFRLPGMLIHNANGQHLMYLLSIGHFISSLQFKLYCIAKLLSIRFIRTAMKNSPCIS